MLEASTRLSYDHLLGYATRHTRIPDASKQTQQQDDHRFEELVDFPASVYTAAKSTLLKQLSSLGEAPPTRNSPALNFIGRDLELHKDKQWNNFYKWNETRFFKDRHYLTRAFPALHTALHSLEHVHILEAGCGVANAMLPLLEAYPHVSATVVDYAPRAVELVKQNKLYDGRRMQAYVRDICEDLTLHTRFDFATMIFVLSAISPVDMKRAVENVTRTLKPGGMVLFRDYGLYDMAQLRFHADQMLSHNFYVRQDGTCSFFFSLEGVRKLFVDECGLEQVSACYIRRRVVNQKEGKEMLRVFVNACFRKSRNTSGSPRCG